MIFKFPGRRGGSGSEPTSKLSFRHLARVRGYWEALRGPGGALPPGEKVDPRGLANALEYCFIADRIGNGLLRIRIAGSALNSLAGVDLKGLPLSMLFTSDARARLATAVADVLNRPVAAELHLEAERGIGRPSLEGRLQLLPLLNLDGTPGQVLGILEVEGNIGNHPRRFAVSRLVTEILSVPEKHDPASFPTALGAKAKISPVVKPREEAALRASDFTLAKPEAKSDAFIASQISDFREKPVTLKSLSEVARLVSAQDTTSPEGNASAAGAEALAPKTAPSAPSRGHLRLVHSS